MKKLLRGIVEFRKNVRPSVKDTFAELALGQRPDTLLIACSDSRVVPNLFASVDPGDMFVVRNVGNMIPPCGAHGHSSSDESEAAAIEFALRRLPVREIIVCGHSECGAMNVLAGGLEGPLELTKLSPNLLGWLRHSKGSRQKLKEGVTLDSHLERHNQLSQLNVLEQIDHLKTYPVVADRLKDGSLTLHAWWFDIKEADVYEFDWAQEKFRLIDETFANELLLAADKAGKPD